MGNRFDRPDLKIEEPNLSSDNDNINYEVTKGKQVSFYPSNLQKLAELKKKRGIRSDSALLRKLIDEAHEREIK